MKDIDPKNTPEVSGGYSPADDGCIPIFPVPRDYPPFPIDPCPKPIPDSTGPETFGPVM